ncbi:hypothetical protein LTR28_011572 [Elasticomyces elasticus]|nr:hypothetical protein LTR28_011572 [Elasticomyces elasticus]
MSATTTVQARQPTPPPSGELHYGLQRVAEHNAAQGYYDSHDGQYAQAASSQYQTQYYGDSQYPEVYDHHQVGLGIQYVNASRFSTALKAKVTDNAQDDTYSQSSQSYYPHGPQSYSSNPYGSGLQVHTPPTPRSTTASEGGRRTRSGRNIGRADSPHSSKGGQSRASKSPRVKKLKPKSDRNKTPKLDKPLSVLTKDMTVPVKDMDAWVNRPAEQRRQEVEKRNGYVTRPMNSFMLYRSAYAERTKQWCLQNNHQVVSSVSGESWPLESPEVRDMYNELAKLERLNHQLAHPTYKFSPSKAAAKKRKGDGSDDEDEPSDLDDPDAEWGPPNRKTKQVKRQGREAGYPINSTYQLDPYATYAPNIDMNQSSWNMTNGGKPPPVPYGTTDAYGNPYYQTAIQQNLHFADGKELKMRRTETPGSQYGHSLSALPGSNHHDLFQPVQSRAHTPASSYQQLMEPDLFNFDAPLYMQSVGQHPDSNYGMLPSQDSHFNSVYGDYATAATPGKDYNMETWQIDPMLASMEGETEFDSLFDEKPHM